MTHILIPLAISIIIAYLLYRGRDERLIYDELYRFGIIKAEWQEYYSIITVHCIYDSKRIEVDLNIYKDLENNVYAEIDAIYEGMEEIKMIGDSYKFLSNQLTDVDILDKYINILYTDIINEIPLKL